MWGIFFTVSRIFFHVFTCDFFTYFFSFLRVIFSRENNLRSRMFVRCGVFFLRSRMFVRCGVFFEITNV